MERRHLEPHRMKEVLCGWRLAFEDNLAPFAPARYIFSKKEHSLRDWYLGGLFEGKTAFEVALLMPKLIFVRIVYDLEEVAYDTYIYKTFTVIEKSRLYPKHLAIIQKWLEYHNIL